MWGRGPPPEEQGRTGAVGEPLMPARPMAVPDGRRGCWVKSQPVPEQKVSFEPSEGLWWVWSLILNTILPLYHLAGAFLCPLVWGIFFWWDPTLSCQWLFFSKF